MTTSLEKPEKKTTSSGGIDYNRTAFVLIDTDGKQYGPYRIRNKKEHDDLVIKARSKRQHVYYGTVTFNEVTRQHQLNTPLIVDFDSVHDKAGGSWGAQDKVNKAEYLTCPYCDGKEFTSKPGQTLHIKSAHPDKFEEFKQSSR